MQRSLQGALKLANVFKKRVLSEKISDMLSNRESVTVAAAAAAGAASGGGKNTNIFARKRVYGDTQ